MGDHQTARHEHLCSLVIPLAVFAAIMGKEELKLINWDVLWLVAGGIAIGIGLNKTG